MLLDNNKLPDFMIVGAPKSGTTSLYHYLKTNKNIFFPNRKEPWFFSSKDDPNRRGVINNLKDYVELFKPAKTGQIIGEASVSYLCAYDTTIKNIKNVYGKRSKDIKIIMILRNPMDRLFSRYNMFVRDNWIKNEDFLSSVEKEFKQRNPDNYFWDDNYIDCSLYYERVIAYKDNFENVLCIKYDDFKENSEKIVEDVFEFLNVDKIKVNTKIKFNNSGNPKNKLIHNLINHDNIFKRIIKLIVPFDIRVRIKEMINNSNLKPSRISKKDYEYLYNKYFKEDIEKLEKLLGWDLDDWKSYEKYYKK